MIRMLAIGAMCMFLMGCLFVVDSKQNATRTQWHERDRAALVAGESRAEWVRTTFGEPDRISRFEDGTEVWRYRNSQSSESRVGLFLLFRVNVERDSSETLALEIRNGVVTDHWVERR